MGCCSQCCSGARIAVWTLWTINTLASAVYLGISMVTFHNVKDGVRYLTYFENREAYKNSLLASCMLGFLMVLFWIIFSFFVLLGRFFSSLPFGYGVMLGSCTHTGFFMLLAGLVLQTHDSLAQAFQKANIWTSEDYQTYVATYSFNYILCGTYLFIFLVLLFTKGPMTEEREKGSAYAVKTPSPAAAPPPAASGTAAPAAVEIPYNNHGFGTNWPKPYQGGNV